MTVRRRACMATRELRAACLPAGGTRTKVAPVHVGALSVAANQGMGRHSVAAVIAPALRKAAILPLAHTATGMPGGLAGQDSPYSAQPMPLCQAAAVHLCRDRWAEWRHVAGTGQMPWQLGACVRFSAPQGTLKDTWPQAQAIGTDRGQGRQGPACKATSSPGCGTPPVMSHGCAADSHHGTRLCSWLAQQQRSAAADCRLGLRSH